MDTTTTKCDIREIDEKLMELHHAIQQADIETYTSLISEDVTCFEPETKGQLLRGRGLHLFFVEQSQPVKRYHIELIDPVLQVKDSMAFAAYSLHLTEVEGDRETIKTENVTRIFQKEGDKWVLIHFHRSVL